jgi:hypothetical protein
MDSDVLVGAWHSHSNRQRFSEAMRKARSELQDGSFAAISARAWASDPGLREQFGVAVSAGLRRMWSDAAVRAEQSARIRQSYTQELRKQRSERLKANWADAGFREKMMRALRARAGEQPNKERVT